MDQSLLSAVGGSAAETEDSRSLEQLKVAGFVRQVELLRNGTNPKFLDLIDENGFFARVAADKQYIVTKILKVTTGPPYIIQGKQFDIYLASDVIPTLLTIPNISNKTPLQEELVKYCDTIGIEMNAFRIALDDAKKKREKAEGKGLDPEQAMKLIQKNTKLQRASTNPVFQLAVQEAAPPSPLTPEAPPLQSQLTQQLSFGTQRESTQMLEESQDGGVRLSGASFMTEGVGARDSSFTTYSDTNDRFTKYACSADRIEGEQRLVALTNRNRQRNDVSIAKGSLNFQKYKKGTKLTESGLLWEIDHNERLRLCKEYEESKKNEDEGTKKDEKKAGTTEITEEEKKKLEERKVLDRCVELRRRQSFELGAVDLDPMQQLAVPLTRNESMMKLKLGSPGAPQSSLGRKRSREELDFGSQ